MWAVLVKQPDKPEEFVLMTSCGASQTPAQKAPRVFPSDAVLLGDQGHQGVSQPHGGRPRSIRLQRDSNQIYMCTKTPEVTSD